MTATQTEFEYTEYTEPNSSAVEIVYYNRDTNDLVVQLNSGDAYRYSNVPKAVFDVFTDKSRSAGRHYAVTVKREYGPGTPEGYVPYYDEVPVRAAVTDVTRSKNLSYAAGAVVDGQQVTDKQRYFDLLTTPQATEAKLLHRVDFTVEGGTEVKSYDVEAVNVDAAVEALAEVSYALSLNLDVKGVYVSFE